jgi:hypothetical protein
MAGVAAVMFVETLRAEQHAEGEVFQERKAIVQPFILWRTRRKCPTTDKKIATS